MANLEAIRLFVQTVDAGSFTAVSRRLGVTPSAVSRRVAGLERALGVVLLARSTRALRLTTDGAAFHARCSRILEDLEDAQNALARSRKTPTGVLRVDVPNALGRALITPNIARFLERFPELHVELTFRDQKVDLVAEGIDVAIRMGDLVDSDLVARRLGEARFVLCAAPSYLRKHGTPRTPEDFARHRRIGYYRDGRADPFVVVTDAARLNIDPPTRFSANDSSAMMEVARAGLGLIHLFDFAVEGVIARGDLVEIEGFRGMTWPIHAVYRRNAHLVAKVSAFLDFVAELFSRTPAVRGAKRRVNARTR